MLEEKQEILEKNTFLNDRKIAKENDKLKKVKRKYLILSVFLCIVIISAIYLASSISNVKGIIVEGNLYLTSENVIEDSNLKLENKFVFVSTNGVANNLLKNPLIEKCEVVKQEDQTIKIVVKEKKIIGYAFEEGNNVLILSDNSRVNIDKSNLYLIGFVPLIEGFSSDQIILIEKNLVDVDYRMINEISEIHYYRDQKFLDHEVIMRDGNYVFTSVYGLNLLNSYYSMVTSSESDKKNCYYIEDISGNAYMSACPWISVVEPQTVIDLKPETNQ